MKKIFFRIFVVAFVIGFVMNACKEDKPEPATPDEEKPPIPIGLTATELVSKITVGWNLGNTLDCSGLTWLGANPSVSQMETAWGNPVTTKANITALKNAGFNAVRIPVSWAKCADVNYNIRTDWMARVAEVVDYAVDNGMYVILNTHHDEGIFKFKNADKEKSEKAFRKIWEQIAEKFKNYDEKLVFEALNEPRTINSLNEWSGGTPEERANLNSHYRVFVETVRASGGNNANRVLMINTYAASGDANAINGLEIPKDNASNKIIASIHVYAPYDFALNVKSPVNTWDRNSSKDTSPITAPIDHVYNTFVSKGIPVIIGEFGAMNKNNIDARTEWAEYYVNYAKSKGMPCFWWDNGGVSGDGETFGLLDRKTNNFVFPSIIEALMRGVR
jgi:endoglucanase